MAIGITTFGETTSFDSGLDRVLANLDALDRDVREAAGAELFVEHDAGIMPLAKEKCPVLTGALRASGFTELPVVDAAGIYVEGHFGGPTASYAGYVHEDLTKNHPNGEAKFYENAVVERIRGMDERIAAGIRQRLAL